MNKSKVIEQFFQNDVEVHIQLFCLFGTFRKRAIEWLQCYGSKLAYINAPIDYPDSLTLIGAGKYFTPLYREEKTLCRAFKPREFYDYFSGGDKTLSYRCIPTSTKIYYEKNHDLSSLVKFLRVGDA